ncbi:MAG: peptidylprolyl isomerase [Ferruginibacter sp.]
MKKIYLLLFFVTVSTSIFSQTLFTYGNTAVGKDEFLRAYNKNKIPADNKEKAIREYLDLYIKFKLKVKAAREMKLDTLEALKSDVISFRNQIQDGYMTDEKGLNFLVDEAFDRSQKDLHVLHFFIALDVKGSDDTTLAFKAINETYNQLQAGKTNYTDISKDITTKYIPLKNNDLGFITAFSIPYNYENIVYGLKPGTVSKPYRSKTGYHIFKVIDERKSAGRWKIAQILLAFPPAANDESIKAVKSTADVYYNELMKGADFSEMAKKHSEDKLTYLTGGEMPEFTTGKYDLAFESEVFKLKKDGEISKPFTSAFGYHIIKRVAVTVTPADKNDPGYMYELKQKVMQNERANTAREKFVKDVTRQLGFKKTTTVKDAELFRYADSMNSSTTQAMIKKIPVSGKVIFSFGNYNVTASDWLNFVKDYKSSELYKNENGKELLDKYVEITALEYYKKRLEEFNPEFNYQMQEFREGNMLFEIMERNVWSTAAADSIGLLKQYNSNKGKYLWPESANAIIFSSNNAKTAEEAATQLKAGRNWKQIADSSYGKLQVDSGRYEVSQIPVSAGVKITEGLISSPLINNTDGSATFIKVLKLYPANQQRSFEEAKGLVINDYQVAIEDKWIAELKKKYPVKVNETVLESLFK